MTERHIVEVRLQRAGIVHPVWTWQAARAHGVAVEFLAAILMLESSGGLNVWGHDPGPFSGAGEVTPAGYRAYAAIRDATGECQGCGPGQLTSASYQRLADQAGGCFLPEHNIGVTAHILAGLLQDFHGSVELAAAAYNGGAGGVNQPGPAAYGRRAAVLYNHFLGAIGPA